MKKSKNNMSEENTQNKKAAFDEGNEDNTSKLNSDELQESDPGAKKITNQDERVTNADDQDEVAEDSEKDLVTKKLKGENEKGPSRDDGSPEINTPVYEPEKTEKKVPRMNENL